MERKQINELVALYFQYNPHFNKGIGWRAKANDIITAYANTHNKSYEDIKLCIESSPMTGMPIWTQFEKFFNKKKVEKSNKSHYKGSIQDSTDPNDWF